MIGLAAARFVLYIGHIVAARLSYDRTDYPVTLKEAVVGVGSVVIQAPFFMTPLALMVYTTLPTGLLIGTGILVPDDTAKLFSVLVSHAPRTGFAVCEAVLATAALHLGASAAGDDWVSQVAVEFSAFMVVLGWYINMRLIQRHS